MAGAAREVLAVGPDARDVLAVGEADADQGAQVQQHVEEHAVVLRRGQAEEILENGEVAGAGDRQKLRQALDQAQKHRLQDRHIQSLLYSEKCSFIA